MQTWTHIGYWAARVFIAGLGFLLAMIALFLHQWEEAKLDDKLVSLWCRIESIRERKLAGNYSALEASFATLLGRDNIKRIKLWNYTNPSTTGKIANLVFWLALKFIGIVTVFSIWLYLIWHIKFLHFIIPMLLASNLGFVRLISLMSASTVGYVSLKFILLRNVPAITLRPRLQRNIVIAFSALEAFIFWPTLIHNSVGHGWAIFKVAVLANYAAAIDSAIFLTTSVLVGVNYLIWPALERPIYSLYRHKIFQNRVFLLSVAFVLLTWAIPGWRPFWEVVGKLK